MKFAGLIKSSLIDYPNEIAAVVFTLGCNFNCWYCHNRELIDKDNKNLELIDSADILKFLKSRKGMLDGVVITGGEPTLYPELIEFIKEVKNLGFKVKLDTNGSNPVILKEWIDQGLVDYIAMDIKTSLDNYARIAGSECLKIGDIENSIDSLLNSNIDYEFRTTFSPDITLDDIEKIAKRINGAKNYYIQKYNSPNIKIIKIPHAKEVFLSAQKIAQKYVKNCCLRSVD